MYRVRGERKEKNKGKDCDKIINNNLLFCLTICPKLQEDWTFNFDMVSSKCVFRRMGRF